MLSYTLNREYYFNLWNIFITGQRSEILGLCSLCLIPNLHLQPISDRYLKSFSRTVFTSNTRQIWNLLIRHLSSIIVPSRNKDKLSIQQCSKTWTSIYRVPRSLVQFWQYTSHVQMDKTGNKRNVYKSSGCSFLDFL